MFKRFSLVAALFLLIVGAFYHLLPAQALTLTERKAVVRLEVTTDQGKPLGFSSGTVIDADGRILTNAKLSELFVKYPTAITNVCLTANETDAPSCFMRAILVRTKASADLSLFQVRSVRYNNFWISPEEYRLRTNFSFAFAKPDYTLLDKEGVAASEQVDVLTYTATGASSLTELSSSVGGFVRVTQKGKSIPNLVKLSTKVTSGNGGGGVFNKKNALVGIPAFLKDTTSPNNSFVSLPVINIFLREALGADYLAKKVPFVMTSALNGVQAGSLKTNICPTYARLDPGGKTCRCNDGFFAVGNSCIAGTSYCPIAFGSTARYDDFLKSCQCPNVNGTTTCVKPTPKPVPPKPTATTTPAVPPTATTTKPVPPKVATFSCPANATYNAKTWACECNSGWVRDTKKNACVAKPVAVKK